MRTKGEYIRKRWFLEKGDRDTSIKKEKETRRTLREESEQCNFLYNIGLLGQACRETLLIYSITLALSSLFSSSGKTLSCCLFPSLTNFIDLGQG